MDPLGFSLQWEVSKNCQIVEGLVEYSEAFFFGGYWRPAGDFYTQQVGRNASPTFLFVVNVC